MIEQLRRAAARVGSREGEEAAADHDDGFSGLRVLTAQLLILTGIGSTLEALSRTRREEPDHAGHPLSFERRATPSGSPAAWAPTLLGPFAAVAHLRHVARPSPASAAATRLLDVAVVGAGIAGLAEMLASARREGRSPSLTPVALASAGVLGLLLERRAREVEAERARLERRASVVERLVPRRRSRLDRIVVHV